MNVFGWISIIAAFSIYMGCAEQKFSKAPTEECAQAGVGEGCTLSNDREIFDYQIEVSVPKADILIVNDNSASMSFEQKLLAERFQDFVQKLNDQNIDYRIAVTTTDISSEKNPARPINQNGALQDGKLISLEDGTFYISRSSGSLEKQVQLFNKVISRPETLQCEEFLRLELVSQTGATKLAPEYSTRYQANCPSPDERGLYAASLVLKNNPNSFLRADASFSLIVVSDEDVRSQLYYFNERGFTLSKADEPEDIFKFFKFKFPEKRFVTYPIITATESCKAQQDAQPYGVRSSFGVKYDELAKITGGVVVDICDLKYSESLGQITAGISEQVKDVVLKCELPTDLEVSFSGSSTSVPFTLTGNVLSFSETLAPGTVVRLVYNCF